VTRNLCFIACSFNIVFVAFLVPNKSNTNNRKSMSTKRKVSAQKAPTKTLFNQIYGCQHMHLSSLLFVTDAPLHSTKAAPVLSF